MELQINLEYSLIVTIHCRTFWKTVNIKWMFMPLFMSQEMELLKVKNFMKKWSWLTEAFVSTQRIWKEQVLWVTTKYINKAGWILSWVFLPNSIFSKWWNRKLNVWVELTQTYFQKVKINCNKSFNPQDHLCELIWNELLSEAEI